MTYVRTAILSFLSVLAAVGCTERVLCAEDPTAPGCTPVDGGGDDATTVDAGDAGEVDGGPCGMLCDDPTPVCDEASGDCVQCTASDDSACTGDTSLCDTTSHECVTCLADADCSDPSAARCDAGACVPCDDNAQCVGIAGLGVCDVGACVQCTISDETPCTGNSCDPATNLCTTTPLAMTSTCGACVADSECVADHRCVPMTFSGAAHGSYCMKLASTGCARPFLTALSDRTSLSGAPAADYCGIDESTVSCEAVRALQMSRACADGMDATCMADGALCRMVGLAPNQCTYACGVANQCPTGITCLTGYCGS